MAAMLPDQLVERYCHGFWGYGCLQSPIWVVGMEEGGAHDTSEVLHKIAGWHDRGQAPVQDIHVVHADPPLNRWFVGQGRLQPTWAKIARLLLAFEGRQAVDTSTVRAFQVHELGRPHSGHAMLELLPLPAPAASTWLYSAWSRLPYLQSRHAYEAHISPLRVAALRAMIALHKPTVVCAYGLKHRAQWEQLAGGQMERERIDCAEVLCRSEGGVLYMALPHPLAHGVTNEIFAKAGGRADQWRRRRQATRDTQHS